LNTAEFHHQRRRRAGRAALSRASSASRTRRCSRGYRLANALQCSASAAPPWQPWRSTALYVEVLRLREARRRLRPLNSRAKHEELDYMVNASEAKALLFGERYLDLVSTLRPKFTGVREYVCVDGNVEGMHSYDELLKAPEEDPFVEIDENDASILMYTSGTTAQPKGVVLTYLTLSVYVTNTMNPQTPGAGRHWSVLLSRRRDDDDTEIWGGRTWRSCSST
jgi:acyl-CoA synthetase (AMP-forming)/AMP-acid ligase II